jgi:hydroxymethylbilane synthase
MLPAVGQGALAIQCREDDDAVRDLVSHVDDKQTRRAIDAERSFARRLGASCRLPIAAYAKIESANLTIDGMVADPSGHTVIRDRIVSDYADPERIGEELAEALLSQGAASLLEGT